MRRPSLPYVTAPGNVLKALVAIRRVPVPQIVDDEFILNKLEIPGGSGRQIAGWLKRTGFVNFNLSPSDQYLRFHDASTEKEAALQALHTGYAPLFARNPDAHLLDDMRLEQLLREETGYGLGSNVINLMRASIRTLSGIATETPRVPATASAPATAPAPIRHPDIKPAPAQPISSLPDASAAAFAQMQISPVNRTAQPASSNAPVYNIVLNMPSTADESVFAAMFRALKSSLLTAYISLPALQNDTLMLAMRRLLRHTHLLH